MTDPVEADLIAKARAGSFSAFEEIVKRHQRRVYAVARRIVRRHDLADDVAQEAFIRAHRALGDFDLARPFGPWICRIAANLAINRVRSPEHREEPLDDRPSPATAAGADPLAGLLEAEAQAMLERALGALPPEQRAVFVLRVSEELSYREIAEALGISIGTVMSRLWRAREKLRSLLLPYLTDARAARGAP
ncbi:MAG TPA: sigma-70 family RNA polymerase sigma factor [Vicinamibacteria bacterium]|jgi:RNA polymerase sigma-70 factor (ECF subfamily)|nr:sigma-70 family RNA polymerase sigma factor [Vicinamibacteria bacterium]